ncbi:TrkH family potassium uptake protein [Methanomethylophilus alvi]|uniref:TrkH family potassium uptake protein n=1 Tax=Methanomethylophilus alvi TaxID=1291540 RepID=UPI0037DC8AF0
MLFPTLRRRIEHLERWESGTIKVLGMVEVLLAVMLIVVALYAALVGDDASVFARPAPFVLALGLFQYLFFSNRKPMAPSLGILLIVETWLIAFFILAIPFYLSEFSFANSLFESVSAFTTTGATILTDVDAIDGSLLIWRAVMQWAGGITVVIIFTVLLPMLGMGGAGFGSNEFSGVDSSGYAVKISNAAFNFMRIYILMTTAEILILMILGVTPFESVCIAFSNIPTGGLLPANDSMASYSFAVQFVTLVFMFLGATNYYLLFRTFFTKDHKALGKSSEFKWMVKWFVACSLIITAVIVVSDETAYSIDNLGAVGDSLWHATYCIVSAGTSSGFAITDYTTWPALGLMILLVVEFVGGMSGSTAGGIKIHRMMALRSYIVAGMDKIMHPSMVTSMRIDNKTLESNEVSSAVSTIFLFMVGIVVALCALMFLEPQLDVQTDFGVVFAAIANVGVGSGQIGPFDNYDSLKDATKYLMCLLMWLGRMELVLAIMIFTRGFWEDVRLNAGFRVRAMELRHMYKVNKKYR